MKLFTVTVDVQVEAKNDTQAASIVENILICDMQVDNVDITDVFCIEELGDD